MKGKTLKIVNKFLTMLFFTKNLINKFYVKCIFLYISVLDKEKRRLFNTGEPLKKPDVSTLKRD